LAESVIGVDDGESGVGPTQPASFGCSVPQRLRQQEVVVLDLGVEWIGWDVEDGFSAVEVVHVSIWFGSIGFPGWMVNAGVEWVEWIDPGLLESLDAGVLFQSGCDD